GEMSTNRPRASFQRHLLSGGQVFRRTPQLRCCQPSNEDLARSWPSAIEELGPGADKQDAGRYTSHQSERTLAVLKGHFRPQIQLGGYVGHFRPVRTFSAIDAAKVGSQQWGNLAADGGVLDCLPGPSGMD